MLPQEKDTCVLDIYESSEGSTTLRNMFQSGCVSRYWFKAVTVTHRPTPGDKIGGFGCKACEFHLCSVCAQSGSSGFF